MQNVVEIQDPHNWAPANLQNGDIFYNEKLICSTVHLSVGRKEIYETESGEWLMTIEGYKACSRAASIQDFAPPTLMLPDGRIVGNPYIEVDGKTNTSHRFTAKHVAIGKNILGKPYISSATIVYDAKLAFVEEASKAMEKNIDLGRYFMEGTLSDEEKNKGMHHFFDGEMGIWIDSRLKEGSAIITNFIFNKNRGDKTAVTFARRAALQRQPCMPPSKVDAIGGIATVLIGAHITNFKEHELNEMMQEFTETGKVSGADVVESSEDISKADDLENFSFINYEGSPRF